MSTLRLVNRGPGREWWRPAPAPEVDGGAPAAAGVALKPDGRAAFWASMGFTFILFTAPQQFFPVLGTLRIALVTAALAIIACLVDRFVRQQPLTVLTREMWLAAGLAGWAILTVPVSLLPEGSVVFLLDVYFKSLAIFWLFGNAVNTPVRLRQLAWAISLMAVPMAWTALAHFLSASFLPGLEQGPKRIVGYHAFLMANPNDLALMLNLIIPLSVALLLAARRPALRTLLVTVIALSVVAVVVTFSRGGFLTLATVIGVYVWKLRGRPERSWAWAALVLALACLPFLPSGYLERLATIVDIDADVTTSAQLRWDDSATAVRFVVGHPIVGAGVGMNALALNQERGFGWSATAEFRRMLRERREADAGSDQGLRTIAHAFRWTAIHNVYLEYAVELGIPGLILFLLLLAGCVKSVVVVQRRSAEVPALRDFFYLAEGIQISLLAFSVAALFHPVGYSLHFYYIAGLAVAVKAIDAARDRDADVQQDSASRP